MRGPLKLVGILEGAQRAFPTPRGILSLCAGWRRAGCTTICLNYSVAGFRCVLSRPAGIAVSTMGAEVYGVETCAPPSSNCDPGASGIAI